MLNYTCSWANEPEALLPCITYPEENTALQEQQAETSSHPLELASRNQLLADISCLSCKITGSLKSDVSFWGRKTHGKKDPLSGQPAFLIIAACCCLFFLSELTNPKIPTDTGKEKKKYPTQPNNRNLSSLPKEGCDCHNLMKLKCW